MKDSLKELSGIVASANDVFFERHKNIDTLMGIMDKTLRQQGMNADAISIDCISLDKKIVFVLHDSKPDLVDVALGDKSGAIHSSTEHNLLEMDVEKILAIMEVYFS